MRRLKNVGCQAIALALLFSGLAQAREPIRSVELQPSPDAEVILSGIKLTYNDDGSVVLSGHGTAKANAGPGGFDYLVDKRTGVYSTKRMGADRIGKLLSESKNPQTKKLSGRLGALASPASPSDPENLNSIKSLVSPGFYSVYMTVVAKDPPRWELTQTGTDLSWYAYASGGVSWTEYNDRCWATTSSPIDTHWFVSHCAHGAPWYEDSAYVCNYNEGEYYNWDLLDDSQATYVAQSVVVCGRNDAYFDYSWDHQDGGEAAFLIDGSVFWL